MAVAKGLRRRCLLQSSKNSSGQHTLDEQKLYTSQLYTPPSRILAANVDLHLIQGVHPCKGSRPGRCASSNGLLSVFIPCCVNTSFFACTAHFCCKQQPSGCPSCTFEDAYKHAHAQLCQPYRSQHTLWAGKGVGVRAHQDLRSGDLIGAFPPLCVVYGPQGSAPDNEALADAILDQQLTPEQLRCVRMHLLKAWNLGAAQVCPPSESTF
eukprot:1161855-Pelagomonas_calceolata.AAC.4